MKNSNPLPTKARVRTLYLKVTTEAEISLQWGMLLLAYRLVRCNKQGKVNWLKTSLYSDTEVVNLLIKGKPIVIIPS